MDAAASARNGIAGRISRERAASARTNGAKARRSLSGEGVEAPFVRAPVDRSQVKPALRFHLRARRCRVHRISTRVRDDRDPPLLSGETGEQGPVICPTRQEEYFQRKDWTGQITLELFGKLISGRIGTSA